MHAAEFIASVKADPFNMLPPHQSLELSFEQLVGVVYEQDRLLKVLLEVNQRLLDEIDSLKGLA